MSEFKILGISENNPPKRDYLEQEIKHNSLIEAEKLFKILSRFILKERLADPECTLDDMWNKRVNENNL